jgi:hypothetical protein
MLIAEALANHALQAIPALKIQIAKAISATQQQNFA